MASSASSLSRGLGLVYAVAISIFGGLTPIAVTSLTDATGSQMTPAFYLLGAALVGLLAMLMLRETAPLARKNAA